MGRGNYLPPVSKEVEYEMVYIDVLELVKDYEDDPNAYQYVYDELLMIFRDCFIEKYSSFAKAEENKYLSDSVTLVILENELCMVTIADDENKCAVSVIAKEDKYNPSFLNISNRMINTYGKYLKEVALKYYGRYGIRTGPYTTGEVRKEESVSA